MLRVPHGGSSIATIVGIDPGSDTVGIATMDIDVVSREIISTNAFTIMGSRLGNNEWVSELYGDRFRRIAGIRDYLIRFFHQTQPLSIAVEAPFFNHFRPQAFGVLMEVMSMINSAVLAYDMWQVPYRIDPSSVKNAVGASGGAKKEAVREAILRLPNLNSLVDLTLLDEHSLDAVAVAYCRVARLFKGE